ncbi:hypothetical protein [Luteimonas sp. R10]|uniref:hypothetical protein n=1 Tax=Luteimonas sp. R10 TaxID=3108176 RepID=UPI00308E635F|nr:hypothetical protein U3649_17055 [Luteimonas sp. R10]
MDKDWLIAPGQGIGRLTFGLSPEEVAALADLYGKPSPLMSQAGVASDLEEVIAQMEGSLPAEIIEDMRRNAQSMADLDTQSLLGHATVLLEYRDRRLDAVSVEARHEKAHYEDKPVFTLDAREVLALFEKANGAPGRYRSVEAAFDNLAVSLHCFSTTSPQHGIRAMPEAEPDFQQRAVTLRRVPYRPENELDQFVAYSFDG